MKGNKYCLRVAYEGTVYSGFQRQAQGEVTIQGELEDVLSKLLKAPTSIVAAGRTDQGVHALGQVCHFVASTSIPVNRMPLAINSKLPRDIVVWDARLVDCGFHARRDARRKRYRYRLWNERYPSPFWRRFTHHVWQEIDIQAMSEAGSVLVGEHDFASFQASGSTICGTRRTLLTLTIDRKGPFVDLVFEGDGFLYKMVRNMVGTLLEVGMHRRPPHWMKEVLAARDRTVAGPTAPPQGLCLERVFYRPEGCVAEEGQPAGFRKLWFV